MAFLQPYMLWGMLTVAVPVAIHFWYQKRGKTMEWAAMRWLGEQTTLQHRGLRLHEMWLMILRCLLVILLALILSKPVVDWLANAGKPEVVHLVQADGLVTETFRFELERAERRGEPIYWMGTTPEKAGNLARPEGVTASIAYLQQNINALADGNARDFRLYFLNDGSLNARVYVPGIYQLFPATDSSVTRPIDLFKNKPAYKGTIQVLLDYRNAAEAQTVRAALAALAEVYGFAFEIQQKMNPASHHDLVFADHAWTAAQPGTTYVISGNAPQWNMPAQVIQLRDTLRIADSEWVENGRLPEWLGDLVVKQLGLQTNAAPLSKSQLSTFFEKIKPPRGQEQAQLRPWLVLIFILLMAAERWWALHKTVRSDG